MKYLVDLLPNYGSDRKFFIDAPLTNISDRITSHKGSWSRILCDQMKSLKLDVIIGSKDQPWPNDRIILLEHGMEFKGQDFNLFGGWNEKLEIRMNQLMKAISNNRVISLDQTMPDFGVLFKRKDSPYTQEIRDPIIKYLSEIRDYVPYVDRIYKSDTVTVGDSHCLSVYNPFCEISRHDGKTLYGALEIGLENLIEDHHDYATFYFGNIDIRHHIMRQSNPAASIYELCLKYVEQVINLVDNGTLKNVTICEVLPIEDESRRLPKTGYYKGTPFYGTWEQRNWAKDCFNQLLSYYANSTKKFLVYKHPKNYLNILGQLSFDVMEKPGSVHLSREFYRYDFEKREINMKLMY